MIIMGIKGVENIFGIGNTKISITKETRDRLKIYGFKGETWDQILNNVMDEIDRNDKERRERTNR